MGSVGIVQGLPVSALQRPLAAFALNGHKLGPISHRTLPLTLTVSGDGEHVESIRPYIIPHLFLSVLWSTSGHLSSSLLYDRVHFIMFASK